MAHAGHGGVHYPSTARQAWASGLELFAGVMMIITGLFSVIVGIAAMARSSFYVITPNYVFSFNVAAWGWVHLVLGILVGATGIALAAKQSWARITGMILVGLNALAHFLFIPYQPLWSLVIIAVNVAVIWALAVQLREVPPSEEQARQ